MSSAVANGATWWNGAEFYGTPDRNVCHLIAEYFTQHPDEASEVSIMIKGCFSHVTRAPDCSRAGIRQSVDNILKALDGKKKLDIFEPGRLDPSVSLEDTISSCAELVAEGKIGGIGLSEVNARTIEAAAKIHKISAVEVEVSLWTPDILTNGVGAICGKLDIPILAYSPLARGALTGETVRKNSDLPEGDMRRALPRFQDDVLAQNNMIVDEIEKLAARKGVTKGQIAIAWVRQLSGRVVKTEDGEEVKMGLVVPIPSATRPERVVENCEIVTLTEAELREIDDMLARSQIGGNRYTTDLMKYCDL